MSYQIQNLKEATYAIWLKAVSASGKESQEGANNYFVITGLEYMSGIYTYMKSVQRSYEKLEDTKELIRIRKLKKKKKKKRQTDRQTLQRPIEKGQKDKQRSTKN